MLRLKQSVSLRCGWKQALLLLQDLTGQVESFGNAQRQRKGLLFGGHFEHITIEDIV